MSMRRIPRRWWRAIALGWVSACLSACVSAPKAPAPPRFPDFAAPVIPATVPVTGEVRARHDAAWLRLQSGDVRGAARDYAESLRLVPAFYPAAAGLGFVALANRDFAAAAGRFQDVVRQDDRYVPAWRGLVDAELGAGHNAEAIAALERLLALDGSKETDHSRLELLRLKEVQTLVESAAHARDAGRINDADRLLGRALALSPRSAIVLRELAKVQVRAAELDKAEASARLAVDIDPSDANSHAVLALVLDSQGRLADAAAALARAAALDPSFRARAIEAKDRADAAGVPAEMRDVGRLAAVNRAQLAALIGMRLPQVLARNPRKVPAVATDVRGHWAAPWILTVTQAGVMDVFPNHTFQPAAAVRRADLAQAVSALLALATTGRPDQVSRWQAALPAFAGLPPANLLYPAAALSVAAGAMTAVGGQFDPTRTATGADALAAIARIEELAGRGSR
jgi:tetratricopeptide (TPR) repeat protein